MTFYFIKRFTLYFIISFFLFAVVRKNFFSDYKRKSNAQRELLLCIFAAFLSSLLIQMLTPNFMMENAGINLGMENTDFIGSFRNRLGTGWGINFVPFHTIRKYLRYVGGKNAFYNLLGNILIFLPIGIFFPLLWKKFKTLSKVITLVIGLSLSIEFIQYFIGRSVDIDDVILNTLGGVIGYYIYRNFFARKSYAYLAR